MRLLGSSVVCRRRKAESPTIVRLLWSALKTFLRSKQKASTQSRYLYISRSQASRPLRLVHAHSCFQKMAVSSPCLRLASTSLLFLERLCPYVRLSSTLLPRCSDERFTICPADSGPIPRLLISTHTTSNADPNSCITCDDQTHA